MADIVVALPGTLCPPAVFDPLREIVAPEVEVETISWMTTGGPWDLEHLAETIAGSIATRFRGPVILAGHSTGGAVALLIAARHPEALSGLMVIDTGAHMQGHGDVQSIIASIRDDWGDELRARVLDRSFQHDLPADVRSQWLDWARTVPRAAALDALESQARLDLRSELSDIRIPTAVVHGIHDRARTIADAHTLRDGLRFATVDLVPSGHTPMYEVPERVAAVLTDLRARVRDLAQRP